jgi:hypothetical protein
MKYKQGELTEADIKKRQRFWNKKGVFRDPYKERTRKEFQGNAKGACRYEELHEGGYRICFADLPENI